MAGSVNKVIVVGNLGKDPEVHSTQAGSRIVSFTLATIESWTDKASAERKERTERHRVVVFNEPIADIAERCPDEGREGLRRGPVADPQVDRPGWPGALHHRGRGAALQGRDDDAFRFCRKFFATTDHAFAQAESQVASE